MKENLLFMKEYMFNFSLIRFTAYRTCSLRWHIKTIEQYGQVSDLSFQEVNCNAVVLQTVDPQFASTG